ncbi:unnamed protein product [Schistocephalus solidus]|uniref:Reverse transcriptase domain-containing protein n=1 Tax=Schistocephalus solidus TaxID=70667 RepID=A0A183SDB2_SCHSO|nr:unnamed protein product [Schistocephalus solidus]
MRLWPTLTGNQLSPVAPCSWALPSEHTPGNRHDQWAKTGEGLWCCVCLHTCQCGFRRHLGTTDMIFAALQLQEKCQEMRTYLYTTFVQLSQAFEMVNPDGLWKVMQKFGCPERLTHMVRQLHDGMMTNGMKQGCVLTLTVFSLLFSAMLMDAYHDECPGIRIACRTDGHLLNSRPMQAPTRVFTNTVHDLLFVDNCALNIRSEEDMQRSMNLFALGSTLSRNTRINDEFAQRISKTSQAFGRLQASMWNRHDIHLNTKLKMYKAVFLTKLRYAVET